MEADTFKAEVAGCCGDLFTPVGAEGEGSVTAAEQRRQKWGNGVAVEVLVASTVIVVGDAEPSAWCVCIDVHTATSRIAIRR